ncbi:MAG: two-component hybrid sensor and regulator [Burkholderiales bacterium]|jgi:PAS domain S-box-containing protein|nr:two-component hybrid sensor and regulator [Burkholderiales bacterium]
MRNKGPVPQLGIEDPFRQLVESTRDYAIFLLDQRGHILTWNAGAERIKGYTAPEILGHHFSRFYTEDAVARRWPEHELAVAATQGRFEDEGWRVRKDGSRFWANVVITALRDPGGEVRGFSKIARDLSERRRAEESLRHSEERFRLLVEAVRDYAIFMLDTDGRVVSWNAGAERIKGYAAHEIIGKHFSVFYPEDARRKKWPEQELALAREHGRFEDEGPRLRKDGTTFWANVVIAVVFERDGTLRGFAKVTRDLTDLRRVEALEDASRKTNEFLAMLAHELRNPLAPMANALKLLARVPTSDPTELWVREVLERQTGQMSRLVDDLLDVSRVTRSAMVLDRKPLDARKSLRNALDAARQWIEEGRHRLTLAIADERLDVDGDEVRLNQVFQNLLHNAAKYTPQGGEIRVTARREGDEAVISVRDSGVGMTPELIESAFQIFKQGNQSLDRPHGGLGVGLSLVQRLVHLHGGSVQARSEGPGKGAEFIVRLPLRAEPAIIDAASLSKEDGRHTGTPRRVLVVDDNQDAAHALRLLLQTDGHDVMVAADGAAGLALAREHRPDVVLLDIGLPTLNGYEIATRIRADPALKSTVLVAVTGYGQMHDRARASASGFDHHLVKPVEFRALQELLRT